MGKRCKTRITCNDRLWPLADPKIRLFSAVLMSALPPEADIGLILTKGAANDPQRTLATRYRSAMQVLHLGKL